MCICRCKECGSTIPPSPILLHCLPRKLLGGCGRCGGEQPGETCFDARAAIVRDKSRCCFTLHNNFVSSACSLDWRTRRECLVWSSCRYHVFPVSVDCPCCGMWTVSRLVNLAEPSSRGRRLGSHPESCRHACKYSQLHMSVERERKEHTTSRLQKTPTTTPRRVGAMPLDPVAPVCPGKDTHGTLVSDREGRGWPDVTSTV